MTTTTHEFFYVGVAEATDEQLFEGAPFHAHYKLAKYPTLEKARLSMLALIERVGPLAVSIGDIRGALDLAELYQLVAKVNSPEDFFSDDEDREPAAYTCQGGRYIVVFFNTDPEVLQKPDPDANDPENSVATWEIFRDHSECKPGECTHNDVHGD